MPYKMSRSQPHCRSFYEDVWHHMKSSLQQASGLPTRDIVSSYLVPILIQDITAVECPNIMLLAHATRYHSNDKNFSPR